MSALTAPTAQSLLAPTLAPRAAPGRRASTTARRAAGPPQQRPPSRLPQRPPKRPTKLPTKLPTRLPTPGLRRGQVPLPTPAVAGTGHPLARRSTQPVGRRPGGIAGAPGHQAARPVRLTMRGRRVLAAAAAGVVFAIAGGLVVLVGTALAAGLANPLAGAAPATGALGSAPPATLVVAPGDTLWQVAVDVAPAADPRDTVHELMRLNGLTDPHQLRPGTTLVLPAAD